MENVYYYDWDDKNSEKLSVRRCGISLSRKPAERQQEQLENEFNYGKKVKISTLESAKFAFPFGRRSVDERLKIVRKLLDKTTPTGGQGT